MRILTKEKEKKKKEKNCNSLERAGLAIFQPRVNPSPLAAALTIRMVIDVQARFTEGTSAVKASKAT